MLTFITRKKHNITGIRELDNTDELLEFLGIVTEVCIDIETNSLDPLLAKIFLISIGNAERQYVIDATSIDISFINNYSHLLFIGHNIKYDYTVLKANGVVLGRLVYDTMIVEQRVGMGSGRSNALDKVIERRLGIKLKTDKESTRNSFINSDGIFVNDQIIYSGEDVEHLDKIKTIQEELIKKFDMGFLIYQIEFPLITILGDCELEGLVIDKEGWISIIKEKEKEEIELNTKLYEILRLSRHNERIKLEFSKPIPRRSIGLWSNKLHINFNSSTQFKSLFRIFGEDVPKGTRKSKTGEFEETETVGIKNLQLYIKQKPNSELKPFIETFIKYKKTLKHLSSFGYIYLDMISPVTGRLHTVYRQCGADTGRFTSGDTKRNKPNLQQIPKLKKLRQCFSYLPGYKILTIDLTGAELVILGSKAQDFKLIELNEGDMHSYLATASWRKILNDPNYVVSKEINEEKRTEFKNVNYGILYGAGVRKIAETLNVSLESAEKVIETLRSEIPNTFAYMDRVSGDAISQGYVVFNERTFSRRWFPDRSRKAQGKVKRTAINAPIQGTQADMIKETMVEVHKHIMKNKYDAVLLMQVHDELVYAFKDDTFPIEVQYIMTSTANKYLEGVEMKASYIIKDTWSKE